MSQDQPGSRPSASHSLVWIEDLCREVYTTYRNSKAGSAGGGDQVAMSVDIGS